MSVLTDVVSTVETLITEFSWTRTFIVILLVVVSASAIAGGEWYTGYLQLGRLERATALLERLAVLNEKPEIQSSKELKAVKDRLARELHVLVVPSGDSQPVPFANALQFVSGALPWLLLSLFFLPDMRRGDEGASTVIGIAAFLGAAFGTLAAVMPNNWVSGPSLTAFALGPVAVVGTLFVSRRRHRKRRATPAL